MTRWRMAGAVCILAVVLPAQTLAQGPPGPGAVPPGYGQAPPGMPLPVAPGGFAPPGGPALAPAGQNMPPEEALALRADGAPNAFEAGRGAVAEGWYANLGTQAYWLRRPAGMAVGLAEPGTLQTSNVTVTAPVTFQQSNGVTFSIPTTVTASVTQPVFSETGTSAPAGSPSFGNYHDLDNGLSWGFAGTIGYRFDNAAVEFTGFYIPDNRSGQTLLTTAGLTAPSITVNNVVSIVTPTGLVGTPLAVNSQDIANAVATQNAGNTFQAGRLDQPFINIPAGFGGPNGQSIWLQASRVNILMSNTLGNMEFNYRYWPTDLINFIVGGRYIVDRQDLQNFTQNNTATSIENPVDGALYRITTHNQVLLGQLGVEGEYPLAAWLGLGGFLKGGWGSNFSTVDYSLTRGDGLVGFADQRRHENFSQAYELGLYLNICCFDRCHLHLGYNFFWVLDVADAVQQINYDFSQPTAQGSSHGSQFYNGPSLQFELFF
jgi:hypothetical protein